MSRYPFVTMHSFGMRNPSELHDVFRARLDAFSQELPRVHKGDAGALQKARVAARRLRELLPLLQLDRRTTRKLQRRLRKVAGRLGAVRELDVLMTLVDDLGRSDRYGSIALQQLRDAVAAERKTARERLHAKLSLAKLERLARRLERAGGHLEDGFEKHGRRRDAASTHAAVWALEARITRRAARLAETLAVAGTVYASEQLRGVRIAMKKLRYAAELLPQPRDPRVTADISSLKTAQDLLGRLRDLEVLVERGRQIQASSGPPDLTAWRDLGSLVHAVEDDCRQLHASFVHERAMLVAIADRMAGAPARTARIERRAAGQ